METEIFDFLMMACEQKEWQQVACDSYKPQFKIVYSNVCLFLNVNSSCIKCLNTESTTAISINDDDDKDDTLRMYWEH